MNPPLAYSPGSITCFFVPVLGDPVEETSSAGCGIAMSQGVSAWVQPGPETAICLNGQPVKIPAVHDVVARLSPEPVHIFLETTLPIGAGFGVSAASCLSAAFALQRHFDLPQSREELGQIALHAEIRHRTGIGDVVTQLTGGVVWRRWRRGPFDVERLNLPAQPLYYRAFESLPTSAILNSPERVAQVAAEGQEALKWLEKNWADLTMESMLERSLLFAQRADLIRDDRVLSAIKDVENLGGRASMIMLGQSVLATVPTDENWIPCNIDHYGTRYLP